MDAESAALARLETLAPTSLPPDLLGHASRKALLRRFLQSADGDADAAFARLLCTLSWRENEGVRFTLSRTPSDETCVALAKHNRSFFVGFDTRGLPVFCAKNV